MQEGSYGRLRRGVGFKLLNQLLSAGAIAGTWVIVLNAMGGSFGFMLDQLVRTLTGLVGLWRALIRAPNIWFGGRIKGPPRPPLRQRRSS